MTTDEVNNKTTSFADLAANAAKEEVNSTADSEKLQAADSMFEQLATEETQKEEAEAVVEQEVVAEVSEPASDDSGGDEEPSEENASEENASEEVPKEEEAQEVAAAQPAPSMERLKEKHPDMCWYVVNAYSGYEMKVKRALEDRIRTSGIDNLFGDIYVPEETVVELVKGQKRTASRKFFPGYMIVEMVLNEDTWHLVKETPKVAGFVGDKTEPMPLEEDEVMRILNQLEEGAASPAAKLRFEEGETVKVVDGPFSDFNGTVEEVKPEKGKLRVLISIFGRATPVELDFVQVEKC